MIFIAVNLSAQIKTEIEGGLKIGNTSLLDEGIIRFTGSDFEGRVNNNWVSLSNTLNGINNFWQESNGYIYNLNPLGVGINTTIPTAYLHVNGNVKTAGLEANGTIRSSSFIIAENDLITSGKLSMRSENFSYNFGIDQTDGTSISLDIDPYSNDYSNYYSSIRLFKNINSDKNKKLIIYKGDGSYGINHEFSTKDNTVIARTDGNVGIGMSIPHYKLDVNGGIRSNDEIISTNDIQLRLVKGNYGIMHRNNGNHYYIMKTNIGDAYGSVGTTFRPFTLNLSSDDLNLGNSILNIIQSNRSVGVGTNTPDVKLHVDNGTDVSLTGGYLQLGSSTTANIAMDNNEIQARYNGALSTFYIQNEGGNLSIAKNTGKVGIGTTNPTEKLNVNGNILTTGEFISTNPNQLRQVNGPYGLIHRTDNTNYWILSTNENDQYGMWNDYRPFRYKLWNGDLELVNNTMYLDYSTKKVGLGTTTPNQKLDVIGVMRANHNGTQSEYIEIAHGGSNAYINNIGDGDLDFRHDGVTLMSLADSGKLIIGEPSTPGNYKLYVDGGILAEEVKVAISNASDWADDAFDKTPTIESVKSSIQNKSHLKEMPSADFLVENGFSLKEMDAKLLQQIEWLWMHTIRVSEENEVLKNEIQILKNLIKE